MSSLASVSENEVSQFNTPPMMLQTSKRPKIRETKLQKETVEAAEVVQVSLLPLAKAVQTMKDDGYDVRHLRGTLSLWDLTVETVISGKAWNAPIARMQPALESRLLTPEGASSAHNEMLNQANDAYTTFCDYYRKCLYAFPSPSEFSKPNVWPNAQKKRAGLLCLRPTERKGLPLCTLHEVFRIFTIRANTPLPTDSLLAHTALRVASVLCKAMGESFINEDARSTEFDTCVKTLFPSWVKEMHLRAPSELHSGVVDRVLISQKEMYALREDKWEPGQGGGDVYLQVARDYELAINSFRNDAEYSVFLQNGGPMFLICLLGPILFIAGGFHDGRSMIVEPLAEACFMMEDGTDHRQRKLSQLLYALHVGVGDLQKVWRTGLPATFIDGIPRVYSSCTLLQQQPENTSEGTLTFHRPLPESGSQHPLFVATLRPSPSTSSSTATELDVVVKLVNGLYGEEEHRTLGGWGYAPVLHGFSRLDGAPTAYIMEHLGSGWMSLFDFGRSAGAETFKHDIWTTLEKILGKMTTVGIVHGDLRPNNIMVRIDQKTQPVLSEEGATILKVIDFDWAGRAGRVSYPARRNDQIEEVTWPGPAGSVIEASHDCQLVKSWWPAFLATSV